MSKETSKEIIEIISNSSEVRNYFRHSEFELNEKMKELFNSITNKTNLLFLDLHGVADRFDEYENILNTDKNAIVNTDNTAIVVISFVGRSSKTREEARNTIINRIKNNQILFGFLVFNRCVTAGKMGTKEQITSFARNNSPQFKNFYFIDDTDDHINSVNDAIKKNNWKNVFPQLVEYQDDKKKAKIEILKIISNFQEFAKT